MKITQTFGIGLYHAGYTETPWWGVNLPAHLVVIKGTEFYDAKSKGHVDFPITNVLQMIGRADN
ncbi:11352_t:CDS:2 [Funneliformis caledonium]|uniref:11352_t:CDS:1 n=1 Tax=Funneliformis caledonium TaxID=1117310 RepID=A0A9N9GB74_9GLOM|nr:11352_t:CDS:2 [Funneliformis caledonium]